MIVTIKRKKMPIFTNIGNTKYHKLNYYYYYYYKIKHVRKTEDNFGCFIGIVSWYSMV